MADYFTPTIVEQKIANCDMTPLERLFLTHILDSQPDGDGLYFFSETGACDCFELNAEEFRTAFEESCGTKSFVADYFADIFANMDVTKPNIDVDFSGASWERIFQDIICRSSTLKFVVILAAFTCSRMRPDGFCGMATVVTADAVEGMSTYDIRDKLLAEAGFEV